MNNKEIVMVKWEDASCYYGWRYPEDISDKDDYIVYSAGTVVKENNKAIWVALCYCPFSDKASEILKIPKQYIHDVWHVDWIKDE